MRSLLVARLVAATCVLTAVHAEVATLYPDADISIFEAFAGISTYYSNALGGLFAGNTGGNLARRALFHFDVGQVIPEGSIVHSASLTIFMDKYPAGVSRTDTFTLHSLTRAFGEGTSYANGGQGAPPTVNDATWEYASYSIEPWTQMGGDFNSAILASVGIGSSPLSLDNSIAHPFSFSGLQAAVQTWVDTPSSNFGLIMLGAERQPQSARRFVSKEDTRSQYWPKLVIEYDPPNEPTGSCCGLDGGCTATTEVACLAKAGAFAYGPCSERSCPINCENGGCEQGACCLPGSDGCIRGSAGHAAKYTIAMVQTQVQLHRDLAPTTMWTYNGTFPGPTIEARSGEPVEILFINDLRDDAGQLRTSHYLSVEECIHGPSFNKAVPYTVPHLHGGVIPFRWDGHPDFQFGPGENDTYMFPNEQDGAMLWYHDHGLGITRLNVYMGLAGAYILRDQLETDLGLPSGRFELPLVITDRNLNFDGTLRYSDQWVGTYTGEHMLVNGKIRPYTRVERAGYRLRVLNACGTRVLILRMSKNKFHILGSERGILDKRRKSKSIRLAPAERIDLYFDFSKYEAGERLQLANYHGASHAEGEVAQGTPFLEFHVIESEKNKNKPDKYLNANLKKLKAKSKYKRRDFILSEEKDDSCGGKVFRINNGSWDDVDVKVKAGKKEIWTFVNINEGHIHPMHLHLAEFQIDERQPIVYFPGNQTYVKTGYATKPEHYERGWKDVVHVGPMESVTVVVQFDKKHLGRFPYHCHVLEHEDHDMMRQVCTSMFK
ncbi:uncharacterized protein MONBRDRAFT_27601 [Monosiga brevicollis MX1]|uniref:Plastocyanin-like domain-containing protein n=1 Tax=Monosiga brevicollis TaxID=81824 RepID=A9V5R9_MONBE|nr:uncharacterized protein MONBRDRAFT_27601 [Monosiga brevicollis MX1]EDQ87164.1 predicted protein [Monosiga brevicollis MX1]|eukprot:XP_001748107.1 hypothetical protein [Monosiga brevicollis MX1]